jgi:hypothetical protein
VPSQNLFNAASAYPEQLTAIFNLVGHLNTFYGGIDGWQRRQSLIAELHRAEHADPLEFLDPDFAEQPEEIRKSLATQARKDHLRDIREELAKMEKRQEAEI